MKKTCLLFLLAFFTAQITQIFAQDAKKSDNKVIIIEETIDENGNKTIKKITRDLDISDDIKGNRDNMWNFGKGDLDGDILRFQQEEKPTLGVMLRNEGKKLVVVNVMDHSGAKEAGVMEGDILQSLDGKSIETIEDIQNLLADKQIGDKVSLIVDRAGNEQSFSVQLKDNQFPGNFNLQRKAPRWRNFNPGNDNLPFGLMQKPKLGIMVEDDEAGALISDVNERSPAEKAGLKEGDIITSVNGNSITDVDNLIDLISQMKAGTKIKLEYLRDGTKQNTEVTLGGNKIRKRL